MYGSFSIMNAHVTSFGTEYKIYKLISIFVLMNTQEHVYIVYGVTHYYYNNCKIFAHDFSFFHFSKENT